MNELQQLSGCNLPWAAQRAQYALQLANAVQNNQVSKSEASALLNDLIRTDALNSEANDDQARAMLVFGVTQLVTMLA